MADFLLRHGWPLLASVAVKSLFVLALAALVVLFLRRSSAAARHLAWRLALYGLLLLPLFSWIPISIWQIPLAPRTLLVPMDAPVVVPEAPLTPASGGAGKALSLPPTVSSPASPLTPPLSGAGGRSLPWPVWACVLWLLGAVLTLIPTLIGLAGVERLARRSVPITDGPLTELTATLAQELGVKTPVRLLTGEAGTPMTWGWLRPVILLPPDAAEWPEDRLRAVLLHELAHIARADWPAQMASHLACACYWFNPLVWLAARQARLEGERACDDRVILAGVPAPDYARHLLDVARSLRDTPLPAVLPMAQASHVERRLRTVLGKTARRGGVTRLGAFIAGLLMLVILASLTAFRSVAHSPARLASTTPISQDGFTLVAIQRDEGLQQTLTVNTSQGTAQRFDNGSAGIYETAPDATCLWIQPPPQSHVSPIALLAEFRVMVRASTGTTFRLPYALADNGYPPYDQPQLLCVTLPAGYPDTDRYFDISLSDRQGRHATWRLTDLPTMQHTLAHPRLQTVQTQAGFTLRAAAWSNDEDPSLYGREVMTGYGREVMTGMHIVSVPATMAHQWELEAANPILEWNADLPRADDYDARLPVMRSAPRDGWMTPLWQTPYAHDIHYARQDAALCQFETYDEPVTFHNVTLRTPPDNGGLTYCVVSASQSITTPSGVTVTLPRQHTDPTSSPGGLVNAINCDFVVSSGDKPRLLPQSPLCQEFNRPATLQIVLPKPADVSMWGTNNGTLSLGFTLPKPYPTHLADFTVIVRQRVNLQTLPLHFVVPVGPTPPWPTVRGRHTP